MKYVCMRCSYETNFKENMKSHLSRITKCSKNINSFVKSDKELYNLSLKPNKDKLKNIFNCKVCNKNYSRIDSYHRHLKNSKECNQDNIENNDKVNILESNINNITLNNVTNSNITCGDTINKNININILPFDEYWTTEHLDNKDKRYILTSLMKYTTLLNELLENDENLNVIVEENTNEALVFKNCETNYSITFKKYLETEILGIIKKYDDYEEDNETRNKANISLEKVFINKKNDAEVISKKIIESDGY